MSLGETLPRKSSATWMRDGHDACCLWNCWTGIGVILGELISVMRRLGHIPTFVAALLIAQPIGAALCEYRCMPPARNISLSARSRDDLNAPAAASCHKSEQDQTGAETEASSGEFLTSVPAVCAHDAEPVTLSLAVGRSAPVSLDVNALAVSTFFNVRDGRPRLQERANAYSLPAPPGTAPFLARLLRV